MNKKYAVHATLTFALLALANTAAWSHANIVPKDNLDAYTGRSYEEGTSAFMEISLGHGCRSDQGVAFPTRHVSAVFPNGEDLSGIAYTVDGSGTRYAGNALYGIKPSVDGDWDSIHPIPGTVAQYYSHGAKSGDVRAIHWLGGFVPDSMYENLEFKASLPKLDSCVGKLRVYIPVVQYCDSGLKNAWVKTPTANFPAEVISAGYAPFIDVLRNESKNPLSAECGGVGQTVEVYPKDADVDEFLPVNGVTAKADVDDADGGNDNRAASGDWFVLLALAGMMLLRRARCG